MKLVLFWLLGVPASVGAMMAGFSLDAQTAAARPVELRTAPVTQAPTACHTVVLTAEGRYDAPVTCRSGPG